jgi:6-phosphogluconate dehydrogenase
MTQNTHMGVIGLGPMGVGLTFNFADNGYTTVVFDPWTDARTTFADKFIDEIDDRVVLVENLESFVESLPTPRRILLMVKAGDPVDVLLEALYPMLSKGDLVCDGGNAHPRDTDRRSLDAEKRGFGFFGLGISGGEEGARHGPSMMAGGTVDLFDTVAPALNAISAKHNGSPCCSHFGPGGTGHFVKIVHNGIEYAIMQLIGEAYLLMRDGAGMSFDQMADVFDKWNDGALSSYLFGITAGILRTPDDLGDGALIDKILDQAREKGTGQWTVRLALEFGIPVPTIAEAVSARHLSRYGDDRAKAEILLPKPNVQSNVDRGSFVDELEQALCAAVMVSYAQGLHLITAAKPDGNGWVAKPELAGRTWRAGCVIRAEFLEKIITAYVNEPELPNLLMAKELTEDWATSMPGLRGTLCFAIQYGIPVPALSSALAYYDGFGNSRLWSSLIQAQRDCFGAHTYERTDKLGTFHTEWLR